MHRRRTLGPTNVRRAGPRWLLFAAGTVLALGGFPPASAHHAATMFDRDRHVELTGVVREYRWQNPHVHIELEVADENGELRTWRIEGGIPRHMYRQGWRRASFAPGDEASILIWPLKDGSSGGLLIAAKRADGSTLGRYP